MARRTADPEQARSAGPEAHRSARTAAPRGGNGVLALQNTAGNRAVAQRIVQIERGYHLDALRSPGNRFKNQVVDAINTVLQGTGVSATEKDGRLELSGDAHDTNDPRYRLIHDLVSSGRTVTIRQDSTGDNRTDLTAGPNDAGRSREVRLATSSGTDAVVYFDPNTAREKRLVDVWDSGQDRVVKQEMPTFLVLAHELIHAGRIMRGKAAIDPKTGERQVTVYERAGDHNIEIGHLEEILTVGLTPITADRLEQELAEGGALQAFKRTSKADDLLKVADHLHDGDDVTENDLRAALHLPPRASYKTFKQKVLRPSGGGVGGLDRLAAATNTSTTQWRGIIALVAVPVLAYLVWRFQNELAAMLGATGPDTDLQRTPEDHPVAVPVIQRFSIRERTWPEVDKVEVLRQGVFMVSKGAEALVVKTAADTSPIDEVVGAQTGKLLGVNAVQTEAIQINSAEIKAAVERFAQLGEPGKTLAAAIASSKHPHLLAMPYIAGVDLAKAGDQWKDADADTRAGWVKELGRVWLLDLLIHNPDRHPENLRIGTDKKMYAIDQVVGPNAAHSFGGEKVESILSGGVEAAQRKFFTKINAELDGFTIDPATYLAKFQEGVAEVRAQIDALDPATLIPKLIQMRTEQKVELPGITGAQEVIKKTITT